MKTVVVIGLWHLGIINAIGFAEKGYRVIGIERERSKLRRLQDGTPPLFEPGLAQLMKKHQKGGRVRFTANPAAVKEAHYVVIAYDSPVNEHDEVDITPVLTAAKAIAPHLNQYTPVIITSQVPIGTTDRVEKVIKKMNRQWRGGTAYTPENLKLGEAIKRFLKPDMLVLGVDNPIVGQAVAAFYKPFRTEKVFMDTGSAEMVKHAINTWLATSITFINEIATLSDFLGVNALKVGQALKLDARIGSRALLRPGLGFAGGTLARDVKQLQKFARQAHYPSTLLHSIMKINEGTFNSIINKLHDTMGGLKRKKIGILGLTYKPGTSTMRRSPAIALVERLHTQGARCLAYDPHASQAESRLYQKYFRRVGSVAQVAKGADALLLITEWPEFSRLNYGALARTMRRPLLVDSKNYLSPEKLTSAGFTYVGFGQPTQRPDGGKEAV